MSRSKLELIRLSQTLDISDEVSYVHEGNSGFGMPPLHRLSERGPLQDGVTDLGVRLDPRIIQLVLSILSTDWDNQYSIRKQLLNYLSPGITDFIQVRFTHPDGITVRQIDCYQVQGPLYDVGLETNEQILKIGFSLMAPDPLFYDPDRQSVTVVPQIGGTGFPVPVEFPMTFGEDDLSKVIQIDYIGTWIEYPEIELVGQMDDPIVLHLDTGLKLDFTGYDIADAENLIIDLRYGYKTVIDQDGVNQIAGLTADSDLTTWHLQEGFNNIQITADNVGANARVIIRYYYRYIGV